MVVQLATIANESEGFFLGGGGGKIVLSCDDKFRAIGKSRKPEREVPGSFFFFKKRWYEFLTVDPTLTTRREIAPPPPAYPFLLFIIVTRFIYLPPPALFPSAALGYPSITIHLCVFF